MNNSESSWFHIEEGKPVPFGVSSENHGQWIQFSVCCKGKKSCRLHLYQGGERRFSIPMKKMSEYGTEDVFSIVLAGKEVAKELESYEYTYESDKIEFVDPYARAIAGRDKFGNKGKARGRFLFKEFDWSDEKRKNLSFQQMILYQCHVRGFTKNENSKVQHPGTFAGVTEKIPYLKELGVNTLLFLPLYDFNEQALEIPAKKKCNYWGYTKDSYYFAPKQSYAGKNCCPVTECKKMIKSLHQNGMNIIMDMHFEGKTPDYILECLRFYVLEYHVDGFMLNQNIVNPALVMDDPILCNVKLLGTTWEPPMETGPIRFGEFNDGFMVDARRFLKSDEGQVGNFFGRFRKQGERVATINYITQKNGFTLHDLVSFDVKHNEPNGEKNLDGTDYNYSWNCGAEGSTRRKTVQIRRVRQQKNALTMLILSLGTPMILAGDEFGNSQKGNNNAYCQDNTTTWLDWNLLEKNKEQFEFTKKLIAFRKRYPVYQSANLQGMDYMGYGAPDISCHGILPWVSNFVNYARELGVLFYGSYFPKDKKTPSKSIYIAMNMHWEEHEFFLPSIQNDQKWKVVFDTTERVAKEEVKATEQSYVLGPRSIVVFQSMTETKKKKA